MKRLTCIACCLLIVFAGVAAAWADCAQISFADSRKEPKQTAARHAHDDHSHSEHQHSHDSAVHCPTLDEFVPTATFSLAEQSRFERMQALLAVFSSVDSLPRRYVRSHGPPGPVTTFRTPQYLVLSILRE